MDFSEKIQNAIKDFFFPDDILLQIPTEEKRKRIYVFVVIVTIIPVLLGMGIMGFHQDGWLKASWSNFANSALLLAVVLIARKSRDGKSAYRLGIAGISFHLLFILILGLDKGGSILWFHLYPLAAFFIFGIFEGLFWILITIIPAFIIIIYPSLTSAVAFPFQFVVSFIVSIATITFVSGLFESLRLHFYRELNKQTVELKVALQNVKTLSGLIPICATCKKIRDDKGYWQAVDQYISTHTDALFSHSICEDCLMKSEPEIYKSLVDQGKIKPSKEGGNDHPADIPTHS